MTCLLLLTNGRANNLKEELNCKDTDQIPTLSVSFKSPPPKKKAPIHTPHTQLMISEQPLNKLLCLELHHTLIT